jgi:hypothetical protein
MTLSQKTEKQKQNPPQQQKAPLSSFSRHSSISDYHGSYDMFWTISKLITSQRNFG